MKKRDWTGGSVFECRFNFAFLPSAWIKARVWLAEQTANISLRRRCAEGLRGILSRTRMKRSLRAVSLPFSPSRRFRSSLAVPFKKKPVRSAGEKCRFSCGVSARNFTPDYELSPELLRRCWLPVVWISKVHRRERNKVVTCVYAFSAALQSE